MSYRELPESVTALEEEVLRLWEEEDTFRMSLEQRAAAPAYVFYEGPPTANGRPGVHHVISRTIKDLIARHRTMTGHRVTRIAGWDTHGLPVELEAEKQLGISGKREIEELGIAEFNRVCRDNIFTYKDDWERLSRRIAYWLDYTRPYITCSPEYVESVWWALAEIDRKGLLYRGYRIVPYCPRCGTGLSSHEVAQGYKQVADPAVYVKFHLVDDPDDARILSWTTTPWTLPGNLALAVGEEIEYVRVRVRQPSEDGRLPAGAAAGEVLVLARELQEAVLRHEVELLDELTGRDLVGLRYRSLFPGAVDAGDSTVAWSVLPADFVTVEEGTGVVHTAVMYGEDDFELGSRVGLPMQHTVDEEGRFVARVPGDLAGRHVKDPDTESAIADWLRENDLLYRREIHQHSYPHCWRCENALLYMARDSWYVRTTEVKDRLLVHNAAVAWHPPEIGHGRMGEWLENNVDWALSRDRYWGTPLPIWECTLDQGHREVIGSYAVLSERVGGLSSDFDPHRPEIDDLEWECAEAGCDGHMQRVPQVADAWFDSGSMPFAQWHYPFENDEAFEGHFPADSIAEGVDQTRGWFYSLLAISTILFDTSPYRAVVVNDLILDAEGLKMSKSRGNVADPWKSIGDYGADVVRFYLISVSNPWLPKRWDPDGLRETERKLFATLRSTYRFFALYANLDGWRHDASSARPSNERGVLDRWLLSRLDALAEEVGRELEGFDLTPAARHIADFVLDDLSNWYVRRSRDRFWGTDPDDDAVEDTADAFATLHEALWTCAALLAPFAPFLSDWIYCATTGTGSVHLSEFPRSQRRIDAELEREVEDIRQLAGLGHAARKEAGLRTRQPLRQLSAVVPEGRRPSAEAVQLLLEELNVKRVVFLSESDEITRLSAKPNFGTLGPRFGSKTPAVAGAISSLEAEEIRSLQRGDEVEVRLGDEEVTVRPAEVVVVEEAIGELAVAGAHGYLVALDPRLDADLVAEGIARELVNRIQRLRKDAGLDVADRIRVGISGAGEVEAAAAEHGEYIASETLALDLRVGRAEELPHTAIVEIDDARVTIGVERVTDR